ncbi:hypothetical protein ACLB2K_011361 [Fragaria x ananassa]
MFFLRIHSVDTNHPISLEDAEFTTISAAAVQSNSRFVEKEGLKALCKEIEPDWLIMNRKQEAKSDALTKPKVEALEELKRVAKDLQVKNDVVEKRKAAASNIRLLAKEDSESEPNRYKAYSVELLVAWANANVPLDVITRWNNTFLMLQAVLKYPDAVEVSYRRA